MSAIARANDRSWIVGDGSSRDPCVDPSRFTTVIATFAVFGSLLLLVALEGWLLWRGCNTLGCFGRCSGRGPWWEPGYQGRGCWQSGARGPVARLANTLAALWSLRFSAAILGDVCCR
jgi:hypothetical protein